MTRDRGNPHARFASSGRSAGTPTLASRARGGAREREAAKSGRITNHESRITAPRPSDVDTRADLFAGLEPRLMCWMSHGDSVVTLPTGFEALARTDHNPVAAMANRRLRQFGVQFHPEVTHTPWGTQVLQNFLYVVCGCR